MNDLRHDDRIGAYLLGALAEDERADLESHLEGCEECRREVARLRPGAEALARGATPVAPPPGLKRAVMEAVEKEAGTAEARRPGALGRLASRGRSGARRLQPLPALRGLPTPAAGLAAVALLLAGAGAGFGLSRALDGDGPSTIRAQVDRSRAPEASARLVVHGEGDGAVITTDGMPSLPRGTVYQVWLRRGGHTSSQSLFTVDEGGRGSGAVRGLDDADAVLVTREPAGGSLAPTGEPMVSVRPG